MELVSVVQWNESTLYCGKIGSSMHVDAFLLSALNNVKYFDSLWIKRLLMEQLYSLFYPHSPYSFYTSQNTLNSCSTFQWNVSLPFVSVILRFSSKNVYDLLHFNFNLFYHFYVLCWMRLIVFQLEGPIVPIKKTLLIISKVLNVEFFSTIYLDLL